MRGMGLWRENSKRALFEDLLIKAQGLRRLGRGLAGLGRGRREAGLLSTDTRPSLSSSPSSRWHPTTPLGGPSHPHDNHCHCAVRKAIRALLIKTPTRALPMFMFQPLRPPKTGASVPLIQRTLPWQRDYFSQLQLHPFNQVSFWYVNLLYKLWSLCCSSQSVMIGECIISFRDLKLPVPALLLHYQQKVKSDQTLLHTFRILIGDTNVTNSFLTTFKTSNGF